MRSLCRSSVVSIAPLPVILLLCTVGVHAQSAATFSNHPAQSSSSAIPAPFAAYISPWLSARQSSAPETPGPSTTFRLPPLSPGTIHNLKTLDAQRLGLLARNEGPCYALRSYGFTTGHDIASAPHLSTYTACTPASRTHFNEIVKTPSSQ